MTTVHFNGSRCSGAAPATLGDLLAVMGREPLHPSFGGCIGPVVALGPVHFFGNFWAFSHAFSIATDDPDTIESLLCAIQTNHASDAYREARAAHRERL